MSKGQIAEKEEYDIRYSTTEDLSYLRNWVDREEAMRCFPVSNSEDVASMVQNWIGFSRFKASLTAIYQEIPIGIATLFLMPYRKLIHHSLVYFAIDPKFMGSGVESSLIRNINHLGKSRFRFERLYFETFAGCFAIPLFEKEGYKQVVHQENHVKERDGRYYARVILTIEL